MSKTKKGLKLAEVVLIIEVVLAIAVGAIVYALGSTSSASAWDNILAASKYALFIVTFGFVNLGGFALEIAEFIIAIFAYTNLIIWLVLFIKFIGSKTPRYLLSLFGYLGGFVAAVLAVAFFRQIAEPVFNSLSEPTRLLVMGVSMLCFIIYLLALLCAIAGLTGSNKDVANRKEAKAKAEEDKERAAELEKVNEKIADLERRVSALESLLIKGEKAKPQKEKVVVVEKVVEKEPKPEPKPEPVSEPAAAEKKSIERIPFAVKLGKADKDLKKKYNELKAFLLSFGVKSRISVSGDSFRAHKETYAIISVAGKHLKVYLPLKAKDYEGTTMPVVDVSHFNKYKETPLAINVRSDLSVKRAKILISQVMREKGAQPGELVEKNYASQVVKEAKAK